MFSDPLSPQVQIISWLLKRGGTISFRKFNKKCDQLRANPVHMLNLLISEGIVKKLSARSEEVITITDLALAGRILNELDIKPPHHSGRVRLK